MSTDGDDGAAGTEQAPWRTIAYAVSQAKPGLTIYVRGGRYEEYVDEHAAIRATVSGTAGAWITLRNHPGERPVIVSKNPTNSTFQFFGPSYWEIRGFEFAGAGRGEGSGIGIGNKSHSINIVDNWVHGYAGGGIESYHASRLTIEGNRVWGNSFYARRQTSGISMYQAVDSPGRAHPSGYHNVIRNNVVYGNENKVVGPAGVVTDGNCIIIDDNRQTQNGSSYPTYQGTTLIENNVCANNGGRGIHVYLSDNVTAIKNTLVRNARHAQIDNGEMSAINSSNITFRDNSVQARAGLDPKKVYESQKVTFENNTYAGTAPASLGSGERVVADLGLSWSGDIPD